MASRVGITKLLKCYRETGTIARKILPRSKVATKILLLVNIYMYGICSTLVIVERICKKKMVKMFTFGRKHESLHLGVFEYADSKF